MAKILIFMLSLLAAFPAREPSVEPRIVVLHQSSRAFHILVVLPSGSIDASRFAIYGAGIKPISGAIPKASTLIEQEVPRVSLGKGSLVLAIYDLNGRLTYIRGVGYDPEVSGLPIAVTSGLSILTGVLVTLATIVVQQYVKKRGLASEARQRYLDQMLHRIERLGTAAAIGGQPPVFEELVLESVGASVAEFRLRQLRVDALRSMYAEYGAGLFKNPEASIRLADLTASLNTTVE